MKLDNETKSVIETTQRIKRLVDSEDWKLAKKSLEDKIDVLNSISSLPLNLSQDELLREVTIRQGAIDLIKNWINQVEAEAQTADPNVEAMTIETKEEIIKRF